MNGERDRAARRRTSALSVALSAIVVAASVVAVSIGGARAPGPDRQTTMPPPPERCRPAVTASPVSPARRIGSWPFHLVDKGTFLSVTRGVRAGSFVALEACGAEESSLRIVELGTGPAAIRSASAQFAKAAPVASSLAASAAAVVLGTGRLGLAGSANVPPYHLALSELAPSSLEPLGKVALGRGYGVELAPGPGGSLVVSTGRQLLELDRSGRINTVASFPRVVAQQLAVVPGSDLALVSLFSPAATPPSPSTQLALVDLATDRVVSSLALPAGEEVESLAAEPKAAFAAVSDGAATTVERLALFPRLQATAPPARPLPTTLTPLAVSGGKRVLVTGATTLACLAPGSGTVLASTTPSGPAEDVTSIATDGRTTYVVTPAGIGTLALPARCR